MKVGARLGLGLVAAYRMTLASVLGGRCRFVPSCSEYAGEAFEKHGFMRGGLLAVLRVGRCGPGCAHGFDPVPGVWQDALPHWVKRLYKSTN